MYTLEVYYSVHNGGDGSAYPHWYESEELAEFAQEGEEWGEPCTGSLTLRSESPIICDEIDSKEDYLLEMLDQFGENVGEEYEDSYYHKPAEFLVKFFDSPDITIELSSYVEETVDSEYVYTKFIVNGKLTNKQFIRKTDIVSRLDQYKEDLIKLKEFAIAKGYL